MNNRFTLIFSSSPAFYCLPSAVPSCWLLTLYHASNGIVLGDDPSLLSEVRVPGGLLAASAVLILLGTFRRSLRSQAMILTVLVYGSFGLARLLGLALDSMPSSRLFASTAIELIVAAIGLVILSRSGATSAWPSRELTTARAAR